MINKNIKAVCFDFGGVIELHEGNILKDLAKLLDVPFDDIKNEYFRHNHLTNVKNMKWEDAALEIISLYDKTQKTKERALSMIRNFFSNGKLNTELLDIFKILKKQGFKVAIFSNNTLQLRERLIESGIIKLVDEVVISAEIGFQKPHKEAFQVLFEKIDVRPEEVVFIDDTPKSLEKSDEIGYIPILFKNNSQLRIELKKLGIEL